MQLIERGPLLHYRWVIRILNIYGIWRCDVVACGRALKEKKKLIADVCFRLHEWRCSYMHQLTCSGEFETV